MSYTATRLRFVKKRRVNVPVEDDLYEVLKQEALRLDTTVAEVVRLCAHNFLIKKGVPKKRRKKSDER